MYIVKLTNKINNVITLSILNIMLLSAFSLYFLSNIMIYISNKNIEIYMLFIIYLTLFSIYNQYKNDVLIQIRLKRILILFCIFFCILAIEYILSYHLTMAVNHDYLLDTGRPPQGKTIEGFEQEYLAYIKKFPEYKSGFMYFIWLIIFIFRCIFYICISAFFIYPSYTIRFITKRVFSQKNVICSKEILFILPIFTPMIICIIFILNIFTH